MPCKYKPCKLSLVSGIFYQTALKYIWKQKSVRMYILEKMQKKKIPEIFLYQCTLLPQRIESVLFYLSEYLNTE